MPVLPSSFLWLAANLVLLPFSYFNSSSVQGSRNPLADNSLLVLLVLNHYRKCVTTSESITTNMKETSYFIDNPYCKALESARDIECEFVFSFSFKMGYSKNKIMWLGTCRQSFKRQSIAIMFTV